MNGMKPLTGVVVLDLSRVLAGPLCAQTLGDLGAEVVKVEATGAGDESRSWSPFFNGLATAYIAANRNKKSVAIDLKTPDGLEILHRLVRECDVIVESSTPGASARLGTDYASLKKVNPKIIYCSISGFGQTGPLSHLPGYDMILQAYSGMMSITGVEGGDAVRIPFSPIDQATGYHAVVGVLAALLQRGISGEGCFIDVSLYETAASFLGYMLQAYVGNDTLPKRSGSSHGGIVPYQAFESADGEVLIGIANDRAWRAFCAEFGREDLLDDSRFVLNKDRVANREDVVAIVQDLVGKVDAATLIQRLQSARIPCAPINDLRDLMESAHAEARGLIQPITGRPMIEGMKAVVLPIMFDGAPRDLGLPPPLLGEHTDEVLERLGYSGKDIAALEEAGVVERAEIRA